MWENYDIGKNGNDSSVGKQQLSGKPTARPSKKGCSTRMQEMKEKERLKAENAGEKDLEAAELWWC